MVEAGVIEDYTYLWYDVRPHPNFGTVEIRAMDAQTRVEHTLGAGGADPGDGQGAGRALRGRQAARATTRTRCSTRTSGSPRATGSRASWSTCPSASACPPRSSRSGSTTACASTRRTSARPPSSRAIEDLLERGNGAHRQRVVYEANHDFSEVMHEIVAATAP